MCVCCAVNYLKKIDFYSLLDSYVALLEGNLGNLQIIWNQFCSVIWGQFPDLQTPISVSSWGFDDVHPDLFNEYCFQNNDGSLKGKRCRVITHTFKKFMT